LTSDRIRKKNHDVKGQDLTPAQRLAVKGTGKNILVSAGAGTGKTRVLVERFLHLVTSGEALVTEILALTFTDKAANEMKSRIQQRLKAMGMERARRDLESAYISTFHAFASRLLKQHPVEAGVDPDFSVMAGEEAEMLKEKSLDTALEICCREERKIFELLVTYGEKTVRGGVLKMFQAARDEGKTLLEFFGSQPGPLAETEGPLDPGRLTRLFEEAGERDLVREWERFSSRPDWDWTMASDFRAWSRNFGRRGGKSRKEIWKEISDLTKRYGGFRLDALARPLRPHLEKIAVCFEAQYEAAKKEAACLDFDDLQARLLWFLRKPDAPCRKLRERYRQIFKHIMVDEFQDTNRLQLEIVELCSGGANLFLVGDFKQSIYGFRNAEPGLFWEKARLYRDGKEGVLIPLTRNFRTQGKVLDFINAFFEKLWEEDGLPFEALEADIPGNEAPEAELMVTSLEDEESMAHARMREAKRIAERIESLHDEGVAYGEIAVLLQAMTSSGIYEQALKQAGIPYFVVSGRGFYHQPEIRDMMSLLACLENPLADIPLAAVLRSPFFQISDDSLFWLAHHAKAEDENAPLYGAVQKVRDIPEIPESEKQKISRFREILTEFISEKEKLRISELLDKILDRTAYELSALAHPQGIRRFANLRKLVNLAREQEARDLCSLGDFLKRVRGFENREIREAEAQVEAEESGRVVRILTVHGAKGLEFPVVFVADLAYQWQSSESNWLVAQSGLGYGFQIMNPGTSEPESPLTWTRIKEVRDAREKEEWKRLFYVAVTRAQSRLILSGVHKEKKKPKENFRDMASWMDWIMACREGLPLRLQGAGKDGVRILKKRPALAETKDFKVLLQNTGKEIPPGMMGSKTDARKIGAEAAALLTSRPTKEIRLARAIDLPVSAYALFTRRPEDYWRVYEVGQRAPDVPREEEEKEPFPEEPPFGAGAADFGTAMHRILEKADFREDPEKVFDRWGRFYFRRFSAEEIQEARGILNHFYKTPLVRRLRTAKRIYRELPFMLHERHGLVQGVLDLVYQDSGDGWHLVDYKTAEGDERKMKESGYETQMLFYAHAVSEILGISSITFSVFFLKNRWFYEAELNSRDLAEVAAKVRGWQEEVLGYRSGRIRESRAAEEGTVS